MKKISQQIIAFICFFTGVLTVSAQSVLEETGYLKEGTVIVRVNEQFRHLCSEREIANPHFYSVLTELGNGQVYKMFPNHLPPEKKHDEYGNTLVDLSMIYIIEYNNDIPIPNACHLILSTELFDYAEPYVIPEILYVPNDPLIGNQYYLNSIRAYDAWEIWKGDTNYVVGITDTGYEFNHPDLVDAVKYNYNDPIDGIDNDNDGYVDNFMGWNLGQNNNNPQYVALGHGIHVSGIAGATADNTFGIAGVGFHTKILPVKIDNAMGSLVMSYQGIIYAADHGSHTINCSWGSTFGAGQFGQDIVNYATFNRNVLVVAAAGNSNNERMFYPCSYQNVLCVAGTKVDDLKWENSSYYRRVDISAPGHNVYSTWASGTFVYSGGTSMASPAVAGAAALVWSYFPGLHPLQIAQHLKNTADVIDTISHNQVYEDKLGYGRLNMYRALVDTMVPAVKLVSMSITDNNDNAFVMNDTLRISGDYFNYLAPTQNLSIKLTSTSPYVQIIDSVFYAGVVGTMQSFDNHSSPFLMKLLSGMPSSHDIEIKFSYADTNYTGYDYQFVTANIDFLHLNVNKIATTITSKGVIGYNNNINFQQGVGLTYNAGSSLIACAGFIAGRANNQVSDNIYGFINAFDSDLVPANTVANIIPPQKGDQHIIGQFDDSGAGTQSLDILVEHHSFAWDDAGKENFVIVEYFVINNGDDDLSNLFAGFFADWELRFRSQNRAATNSIDQFGYVFSHDSSLYAAIHLLTDGDFYHYAIDNDGQDGSVNVTDGFSSTEKFMTLSNSRNTGGNAPFGNNVSSVVSTGPYLLPMNDTLHVAFALHIAQSYIELLQSVNNAEQAWNDLIFAGLENPQSAFVSIYPNPFNDELNICFEDEKMIFFEITDVTGRVVYSQTIGNNKCETIQTEKLKSGTYLLKITGQETVVKKLIKL